MLAFKSRDINQRLLEYSPVPGCGYVYTNVIFLFLLSEVTPGSDKENMTVMGACSVAGQDLPPMTVFQRNFVHTSWKPNHPSNYEFYLYLYAKQPGCMDSDTFYKCFEECEKQTRWYQEVCILLPGTLELGAKSSCC